MKQRPTPAELKIFRPPRAHAVLLLLLLFGFVAGPVAGDGGPWIDSVTPDEQRVHEMITLRGTGFGSFEPGVSSVVFSRRGTLQGPGQGQAPVFFAGTPYLWRDDLIQLRVPVGDLVDGVPTPLPLGRLTVRVIRGDEISNAVRFRVIRAPDAHPLTFRQLTAIENDLDVSTVLGAPNRNLARTKDAEVGDVDGDGFPDLIDSNSNNVFNGTRGVLRLNDGAGGFQAIDLEPTVAGDTGVFATVIPPGGSYVGDAAIYDGDLVDLTGDQHPELVQVLTFAGGPRVRVLRHLAPTSGTTFFEDATAAWLPAPTLPGNPDDLAHVDVDLDGFVDVAVSLRGTPFVYLLMNQGGQTFAPPIAVGDAGGSAHDVFFLDADADGHHDVFLVDESGGSQLFFHDGGSPPSFLPGFSASGVIYLAGASADFNADGLPDFVAGGWNGVFPELVTADVYLNDPAQPGSFQRFALPAPGPGRIYDLEAGDLDLDGDVDLVGAVLRAFEVTADDSVVVWLNDGSGGFTELTAGGAGQLFPGIGPYQRLSADLIDLDLDGDLDLYLTGADLQFIGFGLGTVPNQLYENRRLDRP
jgi:hypothetical protein